MNGFVDQLLALPEPIRMGAVFGLAKEHLDLTPDEIETLLDRPERHVRVGAVSVMDKQARRKRTSVAQRDALYELYLRRHDRIDDWDLVDLGAPHVVGGYLLERDRQPLYELARASFWPKRRSAIVATLFLVRAGDVEDTFALAEILRSDPEKFVQTAVGGLLREAGKRDRGRLLAFLDAYADELSRTALRFSMEHLSDEEKARYR